MLFCFVFNVPDYVDYSKWDNNTEWHSSNSTKELADFEDNHTKFLQEYWCNFPWEHSSKLCISLPITKSSQVHGIQKKKKQKIIHVFSHLLYISLFTVYKISVLSLNNEFQIQGKDISIILDIAWIEIY